MESQQSHAASRQGFLVSLVMCSVLLRHETMYCNLSSHLAVGQCDMLKLHDVTHGRMPVSGYFVSIAGRGLHAGDLALQLLLAFLTFHMLFLFCT